MRIEYFTSKQLEGMLEVARGTIIDMDEEIIETSGFELGLAVMDQLEVPLNLITRIDTELTRRAKRTAARKQRKVWKNTGTGVVSDARNIHAWSENLLAEAEKLKRDFEKAPVLGEKNE
jgi:hypothetical protein